MAQNFCTNCGAKINGIGRFCTECGYALNETATTETQSFIPSPAPPVNVYIPKNPMTMGKLSTPDPSLTMLAEYCEKTVATVGADGYTEWVLNQRSDGKFQVDYYRNYMGYENEVHETYAVPDDIWDRVSAVKTQYALKQPTGNRPVGMCGGARLVKIREGDTAIRLEWGTLTQAEAEAYQQIKDIILSAVQSNQKQ